MTGPPISPEVERLVVICPSWVGDVVMATPVLRALRDALPEARLVGVMRPGMDQLLGGTIWLDETIAVDPSGVLGPLRVAAAIRRQRPEVGLLLPNSFRSALTLRLSAVPRRLGYARDGRSFLLTHGIEPPPPSTPVPMIDYYATLAKAALGVDEIDTRMELATTDAQRDAADQLLRGIDGPFILLNPGANRPAKRWPAERFAAVGDALAGRFDLHVVVSGSPVESAVVKAVIDAARWPERFVNLVQRGITLGSLKAVIERAKLVITNDTGPRHIAAAFGTPVVSLFGPTDHRWTTLRCVNEHVVLAEPFLPEELTADEHAPLCAIERIRVGDVITAAEAPLNTSS